MDLSQSGTSIGDTAEINRRGNNPTTDAYETLARIMAAFQARLDADHEVGAYVTNAEIAFHVRSVRCDGPLLVVEGVDEAGEEVIAVQHFSQLDLQLVKLRKLKDEPARIGFLAET